MTELSKVTLKNTKDVIYEALQQALKLIQEKNSTQMDVKAEVEVKKAKETVKVAEAVMKDVSLTEMIHNLRTEGTITLEQVAAKIEDATKGYDSIIEATTIKQQELTDLFGVETALLNLATTTNANEALKVKYQAEFDTIKAEKEALIEAKRVEAESIKAEADAYAKDIKDKADADKKRQEDEWAYELKRKKITDKDALKDELTEERKQAEEEIAEQVADLKEREDAVYDREAAMTTKEEDFAKYKKVADELPKTISIAVDKAVEKAVKDATDRANEIAGYEKAAIENEKKMLENKIQLLEEDNKKKDVTIADLTGKLDKAYEKIQDVANNVANASRPTYVNNPSTGK